MRLRSSHIAALVTLSAGACSEIDFAPAELLEKDRPLAGRVSVEGDPRRSTPAPGERATYELLLASPGPQPAWSYALKVCRYRASDGTDVCAPDDETLGTIDGDAQPPDRLPSVSFVVPDAVALANDELLVQGLICPGGALDGELLAAHRASALATWRGSLNACADKARNGLLVYARLPIQRVAGDRNIVATIETVGFSSPAMDDPTTIATRWESTASAELSAMGCRGRGLPELATSEDPIGIQIDLADDAREGYLAASEIGGEPSAPRVEIPRVDGFASAGEFEIVRDNQQREAQLLQLEWRPPAVNEASGQLVRFWFVSSDDRIDAQASTWTMRALCVVPAL